MADFDGFALSYDGSHFDNLYDLCDKNKNGLLEKDEAVSFLETSYKWLKVSRFR